MRYTHRIRRCNGNKEAWRLVALREDGTEMVDFGGYTTNHSLDGLLRYSAGLLPDPDDVVQIIYFPVHES